MSVSNDDVRHVAALARLGVSDDRLPTLVSELNGILAHMDVLGRVRTAGVTGATGVGSGGTPLREDRVDPIPLSRPVEDIAPHMRHGFFLVPRLESHDELGGTSADGA